MKTVFAWYPVKASGRWVWLKRVGVSVRKELIQEPFCSVYDTCPPINEYERKEYFTIGGADCVDV